MSDPKAMLIDLIALIKSPPSRPRSSSSWTALYLFIPKGGQRPGQQRGRHGALVDAFNTVVPRTGAALQLVAHDNKAG